MSTKRFSSVTHRRDLYLYHVTYARNLPGIAERGLIPQGGKGIGGGVFAEDSAGSVFFTEFGDADPEESAIAFWHRKHRDESQERRATLRVKAAYVAPLAVRAPASYEVPDEWRYPQRVPPEKLEVRKGGKWVSLRKWKTGQER